MWSLVQHGLGNLLCRSKQFCFAKNVLDCVGDLEYPDPISYRKVSPFTVFKMTLAS